MDGVQIAFVGTFVDWLDAWRDLGVHTGMLTQDTHTALRLTSHSLVELTRHCLGELGFKYVLLGKFQTDRLEERFGRYRQLSGSQYHVSITQVFESEKKIRLQDPLRFPSMSEMPAIAHVAGFCAHATLKKLACEACAENLIMQTRDLHAERDI
ncbi:unnamed protein product [Ixodes hexagonus]